MIHYYTYYCGTNVAFIWFYLKLVLKSCGGTAWVMLLTEVLYHFPYIAGYDFCLSTQYVLFESIMNEYILRLKF